MNPEQQQPKPPPGSASPRDIANSSVASCWAVCSARRRARPSAILAAPLRDTFQNLLGPAKQMQAQYLPQIQQKAGTLDVGQIMARVRGA